MTRHTFTLWAALLALFAAPLGGCKDDLCESKEPAFQLDLVLGSGLSAALLAGVNLEVTVSGRTERLTLDSVTSLVQSGRASVSVDLGAAGKGGFVATVVARASDIGGKELARGVRTFWGTGDACNFFELLLRGPADGAVLDGAAEAGGDGDVGLEAGAPDLDIGLDSAPDRGLDRGGACSYQWTRQSLKSTTAHLYGVWGLDRSNIYVVGAKGTFLSWSGTSGLWQESTISGAGDLRAVQGQTVAVTIDAGVSSQVELYAAGAAGTLHVGAVPSGSTTASWSSESTGSSADLSDVWAASQFVVLAVDRAGAVIHGKATVTGSKKSWTWSRRSNSACADRLHGIWAKTPAFAFVTGSRTVSNDAGSTTWGTLCFYDGTALKPVDLTAPLLPTPLLALHGEATNNLWLVGGQGLVVYYDFNNLTDGGVRGSYRVDPSGVSRSLNAVWVAGAQQVFAVGQNRTVLMHDGKAWKTLLSGSPLQLHDVFAVGDEVWAVGEQATILHGKCR